MEPRSTTIVPLRQASAPSAPEIFVVVKPPAGNSNPLDLQVQLLSFGLGANAVTSIGGRSRSSSVNSRVSLDSIGVPENNQSTGMTRSPSIRSNRSTSLMSTNSNPGISNRRVTPLYNLTFHAVLPTVVTDAGTDCKVAKILKRGVDIIGLAILDPTLLSSSPNLLPSIQTPPTPSESLPKQSPSSFLSRFKRMSFKPPEKLTSAFTKSESNASLFSLSGVPIVPLFREATESNIVPSRNSFSPDDGAVSRDSMSISGSRKGIREKRGYRWTIRKWSRKDLVSTGDQAAVNSIRFEWSRGPKPPQNQSAATTTTESTSGINATSPVPKTRSRSNTVSSRPNSVLLEPRLLNLKLPAGEGETVDPNNLVKNRPRSLLSVTGGLGGIHTGGSKTPESERSRSPAPHDSNSEDEGDESDDEDSERIWTCTLFYSTATPNSSNNLERRLQLGSFVPAPHHPKLVGRLAVPSSLSPIALLGEGVGVLSVEEMKDILFVTALWLIVRENLGGGVGSGGKKKKGEGLLKSMGINN